MTEDLEQRFTQKALATRSDAYQWLWANRAQIAAVLARHARRPWQALANTAADEGKSFTAPALRMAWQRLERDLAREGVTAAGKSEPTSNPALSPLSSRAQPETTTDQETDYGFRFAGEWKPKNTN